MKVGVLGAGQMGSGIAEVFALAGHRVGIFDVDKSQIEKALRNIRWSVEKLTEKGKVKDVEEVMSRIEVLPGVEAVRGDDLILEAVFEDFNVKIDVLRKASEEANDESIIASNTSSIPITELSRAVRMPARFVGMHFFNPPVLMPLVEVIRGDNTGPIYFNRAIDIVRGLGKTPLPVRKDVPGFVVNRILFRIFNAACGLLGKYTVEQIDSVAYYELGFPMGIFMLLDYTGLDLNLSISKEVAKRGLRLECPPVETLVKEGKKGTKSGAGFYNWASRPRIMMVGGGPDPKEIVRPAFEEGKWLIREGIVTEEEVDEGTRLGLGLKEGIITLSKRLGLS
ncbi:3-hydroxybutyryl-CoA dehydrogenase [Sulfodiicoccus acidiphilus]|uniref:3-hydroxybutyryl-CoA dehydrogenase n=1 Tax=Sulfodiicoccus acidiphilus TaxID=1670455 RepID=A0A348B6S4_9CREN|nr:3-hydroxyacyl-CoA dehydrogenase [Sulfodiicoccus acidiphilus]BBD73876.1 3-hydroxybutyryl-CoA dehydrogenase [Sulfodiicoccus acidiphilus]GGT96169.1 3-hydroxybutyryl-CoA dehydrogenase [Sulfodiicoccus acidiphilus]